MVIIVFCKTLKCTENLLIIWHDTQSLIARFYRPANTLIPILRLRAVYWVPSIDNHYLQNIGHGHDLDDPSCVEKSQEGMTLLWSLKFSCGSLLDFSVVVYLQYIWSWSVFVFCVSQIQSYICQGQSHMGPSNVCFLSRHAGISLSILWQGRTTNEYMNTLG